MHLNSNFVEELKWWVSNMELSNGRPVIQVTDWLQLTIQTDQ